jgi:hypothetical protein
VKQRTTHRFVPVPNLFLDHWLPILTPAESRVWLYIFRHSYGFRKESVTLSHEEIATGRKRQDGKSTMDIGTNLKTSGVRKAIKLLTYRGILKVEGSRKPSTNLLMLMAFACYCSNRQNYVCLLPQ